MSDHTATLSPPLRIAVTGATGLVGSRLVPFLRAGGHTVHRIVRTPTGAPDQIAWNPQRGEIDAAALEGVDAVVHLAGESIAGGRWNAARKERIRSSRIEGTTLLARTLAGLDRPPAVLVSTSAVGYYGDRGGQRLTEASGSGEGFLAEVCRVWEASADPARAAGIRVVHPRFGVVLAGEGGLLKQLSLPFRFGLGGKIGNGEQYLSWIAIDDLLTLLLEAIRNDALDGAVNAVAPGAVTNAEFTEALGRTLHRPTFLPLPAFAARAAFGEMADELLLVSQRAEPAVLHNAGFHFIYPDITSALGHELAPGAS
ncbi:MAG: TIGR01777 family protein [Thermomicrobiales bacterium]|nr:TIGR01777 family protein [Thermomicrobiales bacterium]